MTTPLLVIVTLIYVGVACSELYRSNLPNAVVFGGYALANVGLITGIARA